VLRALGRQLTGDERVDLAACLPAEAALAFTSQIPDLAQVPLPRWPAGTLEPSSPSSATLSEPPSWTASSTSSPSGYALLFGRAELIPAA
jgi:hypothetical protein